MYSIQLVQENDISSLAKIMSECFSKADPEKPWDVEHATVYLQYCFKRQPDMFFVSYDKDKYPVGAMAINIKPWRTGMRCSDGILFVDTNHQKQGIAKLLMKRVIKEAVDKYNATTFEGVTFAFNTFPLTWYKSIGFAPDDHVVFIKGDCLDMLSKLSE